MSIKKLALLFAIVVATCLGAATGHAASARTWVSNTGNDSNPCSVTQPCLTFAGAIANTSSGGEIDCLTPGGFGAVTISMPVTIDCEGASNGGITVTSGFAITISTTGTVNLFGLDLNGVDQEDTGVGITAAATVTIRNCKIYGFINGISFPLSSGATLVVDNVLLSGNLTALIEESNSGIQNMTVRNSTISNNTNYGIFVSVNGGTHAGATIEQTTLAFNGIGLYVQDPGAVAVIGGNTLVSNGKGVWVNGGTAYSFENNQIGGNSTDILGTINAYPGGPLN